MSKSGKILISLAMIDTGRIPDIFQAIKFTPRRINDKFIFNTSIFYGTSPQFDDISEGEKIPQYNIEVSEGFDGKLVAKAVRKEWKQCLIT